MTRDGNLPRRNYRLAGASTRTRGRRGGKIFPPIPGTFIRSAIFLNPPCSSRYSTMMRCAVRSPARGSFYSCAAVAVFSSTVSRSTASAFRAASRSASFRVWPDPVPTSRPPTSTSTANTFR